GETSGDYSGFSVSMPDSNTVAIGARHNDGNCFQSCGHVRVYAWDGISWSQKGTDIDGEFAFDESGFSVCMPDINTVAIGALGNPGAGNNGNGHARVYQWNGGAWVQKGADIDGYAAGDWLGITLSMPDSNVIAVGAPNSGGGYTKIYTWDGTSWTQKGV